VDEEAIFQAASEIADRQARRNFLDGVCQGDAVLLDRLLDLLRVHEQDDQFLAVPAVDQISHDGPLSQTVDGPTDVFLSAKSNCRPVGPSRA
jgi:hypothetical protein